MEQSDYERVVADMRLANGLPWSIPITLSVVDLPPQGGSWIRLDDPTGRFVGVLHLKISLRQDLKQSMSTVLMTPNTQASR